MHAFMEMNSNNRKELRTMEHGKYSDIMSKKLPLGIQGFEKLRTDHFLYIDKTEYIYQLPVHWVIALRSFWRWLIIGQVYAV